MNKPDFSKSKVGDRVAGIFQGPRVNAGETNGYIKAIVKEDYGYPIRVYFDDGQEESYTMDGHNYLNDKGPSLYHTMPEIIGGCEPPKRKKKIRITGTINLYSSLGDYRQWSISDIYPTLQKALENAGESCIGQLNIDQEIEVDEEC